ncbi:hypothetical protein [Dactylosporangium sp. CA-233914]|uniref:hypothetical protein n=1 Tax=Dactylosporangium sp. CA-233914 TaxID=3239934 RepID=UPI003D8C8D61
MDGQISCGPSRSRPRTRHIARSGDFLAYDRNRSEQAYNDMGDAVVFFYLLGHEHGHGIQQRGLL